MNLRSKPFRLLRTPLRQSKKLIDRHARHSREQLRLPARTPARQRFRWLSTRFGRQEKFGERSGSEWKLTYTKLKVRAYSPEDISNSSFAWQPTATGSTSYTPNNLNQYTAIGTQTTGGTSCSGAAQGLSYDCNGNLTYDGNLTYGYDAENRLMTACKPSPCTSPTVNAAYQYDPLGRRTRKSGTGVTGTFYLSDGADEIAEYDGTSGTLTTRYIPGPAIDEPVAMVDGATGTKTYFHTNHQGSVIAMSGSGGALAEGPYTYDPYGNCFLSATQSPCSSSGEPYRFTGRRFDPETSCYYYRAREYCPAIGRFLQTDPVGYSADLNLYSYVGNEPVNATDPTGSCPLYACRGGGDFGDVEGVNETYSDVSVPDNAFSGSLGNTASQYEGQVGALQSSNGQTNGNTAGNNPHGPRVPAGVTLMDPSNTQTVGPTSVDGQYGYNFTLRINDQYHAPFTACCTSVLEHIDDPTGNTISNDQYQMTIKGKFNDFLGVTRKGPGTTPQSGPSHNISTQSFTIKYNKDIYNITTQFSHEITVVNGVITVTDTMIVP